MGGFSSDILPNRQVNWSENGEIDEKFVKRSQFGDNRAFVNPSLHLAPKFAKTNDFYMNPGFMKISNILNSYSF